ncbi:hypothetical protein V8C26DRAFT_353925 [Trichoderma gracile]
MLVLPTTASDPIFRRGAVTAGSRSNGGRGGRALGEPRDRGPEGAPSKFSVLVSTSMARCLGLSSQVTLREDGEPLSAFRVHPRSPVRAAGCPCPGKGSGDRRKGRQSASAIQGRSHCNGGTTATANDRGDRATVQQRLHGCGSPGTSREGFLATLKVPVDTAPAPPAMRELPGVGPCYTLLGNGAGTKLRLQGYIHTCTLLHLLLWLS